MHIPLALIILAFVGTGQVQAQSTAFTYQGRLIKNGLPVNGMYDFAFSLWNAASGPIQVGEMFASTATPVSNGLFATSLDFGANFLGADRWLEIGVRTNGGTDFTALTPRQRIAAAPYAIFANTASNLSGVLNSAQLRGNYSGAVMFNNGANQFAGNGAGMVDVNAVSLGGLSANQFWKVAGNVGTLPDANFIGTTDDQPFEVRVNNTRALRIESDAGGTPNFIGGAIVNYIPLGVVGSAIVGGGAIDYFGTAFTNLILADFGVISGGSGNAIRTRAVSSSIGGGTANTIEDYAGWSAIGGGSDNLIQPNAGHSVIGGGQNNTIQSNSVLSAIVGGIANLVQSGAAWSAIGGGSGNVIQHDAYYSAIVGGAGNSIQTDAVGSVIAGGENNAIQTNAYDSVVGGGGGNRIMFKGSWSVIAGGEGNSIQENANHACISGGSVNVIQSNASHSVIAGGEGNTIENANHAVIDGGNDNTIQWNNYGSAIGGGAHNTIESNAFMSVIGGGFVNSIEAKADQSTIGGGQRNTIGSNAFLSTVAGGYANRVNANAPYSTIGGGDSNIGAGSYATVPGGRFNVAGRDSFAVGYAANAIDPSSFVWSDGDGGTLSSITSNSVTFRATGGYRLFTNPDRTTGVNLAAGSGSWTSYSDRRAKENFESVNPRQVLDQVAALPITRWNYKSQHKSVRHIGPMAQDFKAAFAVGETDTGITTVDADGVALAAIQGLNDLLKEKDARIAALEKDVIELKHSIDSLMETNDSTCSTRFHRAVTIPWAALR